MKVRCVKDFTFKGKQYKTDDEINVTKEECSLLMEQRLCIIVRQEVVKEKATIKKKVEKAVK